MNKQILIALLVVSVLAWDDLIASNPTQATKDLYVRLQSAQGNHIISGQCAYWDELKGRVGRTPVIQGFDFQNYSPHNPWHDDWSGWDDGTVQKAINFYHGYGGKAVVTFQWHWFSPMGGNLRTSTFYTSSTDFDVNRAVQEGTAEHSATIRDLDTIASQLKRLRDAGVPVLWRPLHEAGGKWFWWGAKGSWASKQLLNIMFERFNNYHQLNNLIWVWSTPEPDWYPGKDRTDLIGFDSYPGSHNYDCNINMFMQLHNIVGGSKLVALTENGPIPNIDHCFQIGAHWSYFNSWGDLVVAQNDDDHLRKTFSHNKVYTIENW